MLMVESVSQARVVATVAEKSSSSARLKVSSVRRTTTAINIVSMKRTRSFMSTECRTRNKVTPSPQSSHGQSRTTDVSNKAKNKFISTLKERVCCFSSPFVCQKIRLILLTKPK